VRAWAAGTAKGGREEREMREAKKRGSEGRLPGSVLRERE
jgi:hypothetical protein